MGIFSQDGEDIAIAEQIFTDCSAAFNYAPGEAHFIKTSVNCDGIRECCEAFERITKIGFPSDPGPFKRLAAISVLSMQWPIYNVTATVERAQHPQLETIWLPRLALWSSARLAPLFTLNDQPGFIEKFSLPTPHFQVEFIGYLRNMVNGRAITGPEISDSLLLERITATGFIFESSAYHDEDPAPHAKRLHERASGCMDAIHKDPILKDDWTFNDFDFQEIAEGIGINDF